MHNKDIKHFSHKNTSVSETEHHHKGQRCIYKGEEAHVIRIKPFLVIRTKNRVVCGAINQQIRLNEQDVQHPPVLYKFI